MVERNSNNSTVFLIVLTTIALSIRFIEFKAERIDSKVLDATQNVTLITYKDTGDHLHRKSINLCDCYYLSKMMQKQNHPNKIAEGARQ